MRPGGEGPGGMEPAGGAGGAGPGGGADPVLGLNCLIILEGTEGVPRNGGRI